MINEGKISFILVRKSLSGMSKVNLQQTKKQKCMVYLKCAADTFSEIKQLLLARSGQ